MNGLRLDRVASHMTACGWHEYPEIERSSGSLPAFCAAEKPPWCFHTAWAGKRPSLPSITRANRKTRCLTSLLGHGVRPDVNHPGFVEAVWFKSGFHGGGLTSTLLVVVCLGLGRRDIADGSEWSLVVEPSHPFERNQFHRLLGFSWCSAMDQLGFVQIVDGLDERIVIAVPLLPTDGSKPASANRSL